MKTADQLRALAARKAKADALPPEVKSKYVDAYLQVCQQLHSLMMSCFCKSTQNINSGIDDETLSDAFDAVSKAYDTYDAELFISSVNRYCTTIPGDDYILTDAKLKQMGFSDYEGKIPFET